MKSIQSMIKLTTFIALGFSMATIAPALAIDLAETQAMTIAQGKPKIDPITIGPVIIIGPPRGIPTLIPVATPTCCPPMNTKVFGTFFKRIDPGNITSPYGLKFDPMGLGQGAQYTAMLDAYKSYYSLLNYLSSGQITNLTIGIYLVNGTDNGVNSAGNPNPPTATGTPIEQAFIGFNSSGTIAPAANAFFNTALQPNKWYGIQEYSYTNVSFKTNPQQAGFEESCNKQIQTWVRWQVMNGRMIRQTINDGKLESVELKGISEK
jgi:hypothetical protein